MQLQVPVPPGKRNKTNPDLTVRILENIQRLMATRETELRRSPLKKLESFVVFLFALAHTLPSSASILKMMMCVPRRGPQVVVLEESQLTLFTKYCVCLFLPGRGYLRTDIGACLYFT